MYEPRFYQEWYNKKLKTFKVCFRETDLLIKAEHCDREYCYQLIKKLRLRFDEYINLNPDFLLSMTPVVIKAGDPEPVKILKKYAEKAEIGPMAGIAGLFAEKVGKSILNKLQTDQVIVENGGDIFLALKEECITGIYAGEDSPFSGKIGIKIKPDSTPLGICTSAGNVGPSLSLGKADAVVVASKSTVMADIMATALANRIKHSRDINRVLEYGRTIEGVTGIVVIKGDKIGICGDIEIVKIDK